MALDGTGPESNRPSVGLPHRTGVEDRTRLWVLGAGNPLRLPSSTSGETANSRHDQDAASKEVG